MLDFVANGMVLGFVVMEYLHLKPYPFHVNDCSIVGPNNFWANFAFPITFFFFLENFPSNTDWTQNFFVFLGRTLSPKPFSKISKHLSLFLFTVHQENSLRELGNDWKIIVFKRLSTHKSCCTSVTNSFNGLKCSDWIVILSTSERMYLFRILNMKNAQRHEIHSESCLAFSQLLSYHPKKDEYNTYWEHLCAHIIRNSAYCAIVCFHRNDNPRHNTEYSMGPSIHRESSVGALWSCWTL